MQRRDFVFATAAILLAGCASQGGPTQPAEAPGMRFSDSERTAIEAFYGKANGPLPPQRVRVGDVVEPGQRPAPLPTSLIAKLPHLPAPYTRYILGNDVALVNRETHAILDVIPQIVR